MRSEAPPLAVALYLLWLYCLLRLPLIRLYLLWQKPLVRSLHAFGSSGSSHGKVLDYGSSHPFAYSSRQQAGNSSGGAGPWGAPGGGGSQLKRPGMGSGGPFGGAGPMGSQPKVQRRLEPGGAISFGEVPQLSAQLDKVRQHVE